MIGKVSLVASLAVAAGLAVAAAPGGAGGDELCFDSAPTITGSGLIVGTDGDDVIVGSDGNDFIKAIGGNDKVCGGAGDDKIGGGPDDDQIDGGPGDDDLSGGRGNDTVLGDEGNDTMQGGSDTDTCDGGPGTNTAVTSGFEACETVRNAGGAATEPNPMALRAVLRAFPGPPPPRDVTRGTGGLFTATLTPTGTGATLVWRLALRRLTGPAVAADIHLARPGRGGPVLVSLCAPCAPGARGRAQVKGQPARRAILSGQAYVNVRTQRNPQGEIRGRIVRG